MAIIITQLECKSINHSKHFVYPQTKANTQTLIDLTIWSYLEIKIIT